MYSLRPGLESFAKLQKIFVLVSCYYALRDKRRTWQIPILYIPHSLLKQEFKAD